MSVDAALAQKLEQLYQRDFAAEDTQSGAPLSIRGVVGASPEQDRLANLRRYYPDAEPTAEGNFVFTDPESGKRTLYNPKGLDVGDLASVGREASQLVGGTAGAAMGAPGGLPGVVAGAGLGTSIAGEIYDAGMRSNADMIDTRGPAQRVADVTADTLGGSLGQAGGMVASRLVGGVARGTANMLSRSQADELVPAFRSIGAEPSPGMVSGGTVQGAESALSKFPGAADKFQERYADVREVMGREADRIIGQFSERPSATSAGHALQRGVDDFVTKTRARYSEMEDQFYAGMPRGSAVPVGSTRRSIDGMRAKLGDNEDLQKALGQPFLERMDRALSGAEVLPLEVFRAMRSRIGERLKDPGLAVTDTSNAELKRLYGAMTEDLREAAKQSGGNTLKTFDRMNSLFEKSMRRYDKVLKPLERQAIPERAFALAMSGGRDGASRLTSIRRSVSPEQWNEVAAETIRRMGLASPGRQDVSGDLFSPESFLTNYAKLPERTKLALFGGTSMKGAKDSLDKLALLSAAIKDSSSFHNFSNTATQLPYTLGLMSILGGGIGAATTGDMEGAGKGVLTGASAVLGGRAAAKLMLSKQFTNWLSRAPTEATKPNGVSAHLGRLIGISRGSPEIRDEIYQFLRAVTGRSSLEHGPEQSYEARRQS